MRILFKKFWGSFSVNTKAKIGSNNGEKIINKQKIIIEHKNRNISETSLKYTNSKIEYIRAIKSTNFDFFSDKSKKLSFIKSLRLQNYLTEWECD